LRDFQEKQKRQAELRKEMNKLNSEIKKIKKDAQDLLN